MRSIRGYTKLSPHVALVRHEDLIVDILNYTTRLLHFLKVESTASQQQRLVEWIKEHTSADDALANPHSTYRNIKGLASQWKSDLSPEELLEIESNCGSVMQQLGYRPTLLNQAEAEEDDDDGDGDGTPVESITSDYPLRVASV